MENDAVNEIMNCNFEPIILQEKKDCDLSAYEKVPFQSIMNISPTLVGIGQLLSSGAAGQTLYTCNMPMNMLTSRLDGSGLTTMVHGSKGIIKNAAFNPIGGAASSVLACNPYVMIAAVALVSINKKLGEIKAAQKDIMDYLVFKDESALRANIQFLSDIFNDYKLNVGNKMFLQNNHSQILNIKRESLQSAEQQRSLIESKINKKNLFHLGMETKKLINTVNDQFNNYQLAIYMYSFSSFLDVVFLENYNEEYLSNVSSKIENQQNYYNDLYKKAFDAIESFSNTSVDSYAAKGLAGASKLLGKAFNKVPVVRNTKLDEKMIAASEKITDFNEGITDKRMDKFKTNVLEATNVFLDNIKLINMTTNRPDSLLIDNEALYIAKV